MIVVSSFFRCKINNKMTHLSIIYQTFVLQVSMRFGCGVVALLIMKGFDFTPSPSYPFLLCPMEEYYLTKNNPLFLNPMSLDPHQCPPPPPFLCTPLVFTLFNTWALFSTYHVYPTYILTYPPFQSLPPPKLKCYRERKEGA